MLFILYIYTFDICCILKVQHSICVVHWKFEICCTLKIEYVLHIKRFNICCTLKIQYLLQIESSICAAHWKFEINCTVKMSPRPFPLLRINSLFHLLRIATADAACSDRVRDKRNKCHKKCQLKVSIPKNSTQIINHLLLLFPLHSVAAIRSLLCPDLKCERWGQFRVRQVQFLFCD